MPINSWRSTSAAPFPGINRMSSIGSPVNRGGMAFAEYADKMPPGWKGLNEERGFRKDENVVMVMGTEGGYDGAQFSPGGYRALQKSGHGGIARRLGVKGNPGPHNFFDFILPGIWVGGRGRPRTFIMVHEMARHLYDLGFKSKEEVYEYIWKKSLEPLSEYRKRSWVDLTTNGWIGVDRQSGKPWKELPDDHMVAVAGDNPRDNCIIVCGSDEEVCFQFTGGAPQHVRVLALLQHRRLEIDSRRGRAGDPPPPHHRRGGHGLPRRGRRGIVRYQRSSHANSQGELRRSRAC